MVRPAEVDEGGRVGIIKTIKEEFNRKFRPGICFHAGVIILHNRYKDRGHFSFSFIEDHAEGKI